MMVKSSFLFSYISLYLSCLTQRSCGFSSNPPLTEDHLKIAKLCRDVYSDDVEKLSGFVESKDTGVQGTVSLDGRRAIVCIRGSDERVNWVYNFKIGKVPFLTRKNTNPDIEVHSGFFIGHTSVKGKIYKKLNEIVQGGKCDRILFCGHSAGVLSALLAYDYINNKNIPIEVVTFGSPRVGNKAFSDDFDRKIKCTRIINDKDLIPLAPLKILGFHHIGTELIHIKNSQANKQKIFWRIKGLLRFDAGVRDHSMEAYVEEIEKCIQRL